MQIQQTNLSEEFHKMEEELKSTIDTEVAEELRLKLLRITKIYELDHLDKCLRILGKLFEKGHSNLFVKDK